jgi:CMP-N-acetylneuraminic acid synthetase
LGSQKNPAVSVYITNHNYGRFIRQAIESVLAQTFTEFELIIIDDGSTDGSREIIEEYRKNGQVVVIFQKNKGLNVSNNIAVRAARGRYVMRLDADDYLDEHALMILVNALDRNADTGLVFPDYYVVDEGGTILEVVRRHDFKGVTLLDQPAHGACTLIRRECILDLGGYDESFRSQDGYELWLRFVQHYQVQNVNLPLFYYRQHFNNLTRNEKQILTTRGNILQKEARKSGRGLSCIAVIPVRGPSTDPASPAFRKLGGMPLIDWTIRSAVGAHRVSTVVVTSPDEKLLSHVKSTYGDRVFPVRRDSSLALPNTYVEDTLLDALDAFTRGHSEPDAFVVLYTESPFRTSQQIDNGFDVMEVFKTETVVSVRPDGDVFYRHNGARLEPLRKTRLLRLEREELYREAGQMFFVRYPFFKKEHRIIGGRMGHLVMDEHSAHRIRTERDWEIATLYAARLDPAISAASGGKEK